MARPRSLILEMERLLAGLLARANRDPATLDAGETPIDITDALKLVDSTAKFLALKFKIAPEKEETEFDTIVAEFHGDGAAISHRGRRPRQRDRDQSPLPAGAATLGPLPTAHANGTDAYPPAEAPETAP